jgi:hypothetical protein
MAWSPEVGGGWMELGEDTEFTWTTGCRNTRYRWNEMDWAQSYKERDQRGSTDKWKIKKAKKDGTSKQMC